MSSHPCLLWHAKACSVVVSHAGDGLATGSDVRNQYRGISDAGLFFEQVLSKPYVNQVCLAAAELPAAKPG